MFKIKIESEIQKTKEKNIDHGNQILDSVNQLLLEQNTEEKELIKSIGINKSLIEKIDKETETHLQRKELQSKTGNDIFTREEIKTMCIKYRLKFLNSIDYIGAIPPDLGAKLVTLKKKHNLNINQSYNSDSGKFFIMAPANCFELKDAKNLNLSIKIDPVMFYEIESGLYILIHKWGKDFTYFRRLLGILMENTIRVKILRFLLILSTVFIINCSMVSYFSNYIMTNNNNLFGLCVFLISIIGITLSIRQAFLATSVTAGSIEGWNKNEKTWRKITINF